MAVPSPLPLSLREREKRKRSLSLRERGRGEGPGPWKKIIAGGQTGVDRAALDAALACGLPCGGWCPRGRRAEDGPIPAGYPLTATPSPAYPQRTRWNVRDADGTLVLTRGRPSRGTALTIALARRLKKPLLVVSLSDRPGRRAVISWAKDHRIRILNVAGPRERTNPGIYAQARQFLHALFTGKAGPARKKTTKRRQNG